MRDDRLHDPEQQKKKQRPEGREKHHFSHPSLSKHVSLFLQHPAAQDSDASILKYKARKG